jgi:hypothetical protein
MAGPDQRARFPSFLQAADNSLHSSGNLIFKTECFRFDNVVFDYLPTDSQYLSDCPAIRFSIRWRRDIPRGSSAPGDMA